MTTLANFPGLLEAFFTDRLMRQRQASPHTIASYRDTFRLLLEFVSLRLKKAPSALSLDDLDAPLIGAFLDHLERERGISARTRNVRLAAIHSFFKYAAFQQPAHSALIQRVLAMPSKRYDKSAIEFLSRSEIDALVAAPDQQTWIGRRDRALLLLAVQSGLRVSELVGLRCQDVVTGSGAHVRCRGKGRKERCTPLRREAVDVLRAWLREQNAPPANPLFPNIRGGQLSRDAVEDLLAKHVCTASLRCLSLKQKHVSPHVLRHTSAMDLLQHGVDRSVIALWLGHESVETTQIYLHANLQLKQAALARTAPLNVRAGRYRPGDRLLAFLKSL
jgi:integrase/recombinase XerD